MANKQEENMLLTEHFSWPPISLLDDIINAVNEVLYRCTDTFETGLLSADPSLLGFADAYAATNRVPAIDPEDSNPVYPEAKLEIEEGTLKLETLMENAVDKNFDRLEIWALRNVFCLPREAGDKDGGGIGGWVRLGGYENLQIPSKDNTLTPEALQHLRRKLTETTKLHTALLAEKKRNEAQIAKLKALLQPPPKQESSPTSPAEEATTSPVAPFSFLTHTPAAKSLGLSISPSSTPTTKPTPPTAQSTTPLTTHTTFTISQLPHLRSLLAQLKPHLPSTALPSSSSSPAGDAASTSKQKEEWAKERRIYVESQSKRALEKRGVDTRDGVEGIEGGRLRVEEVRGLEGIVGMLGKGRGEAMDVDGKEDVGGDGEGNEMDFS